jgi:integrase/recombinase XerC
MEVAGMGLDGRAPGAAALHLAPGVRLLRADEQVFGAMLDGWADQQLARNLATSTITKRAAAVRAFAAHANAEPWEWVAYAFGLRRNEVRMLDLADFGTNPHAPEFGTYGLCRVRHGKTKKGSPPRRRSVLTVWPWTPGIIAQWTEEARPQMRHAGGSKALWPSERGGRIAATSLDRRFAAYCAALGLDDGLDVHSLRRSYVTHLTEDGWDPLFVQQQAGHEYASTTAIYTCVSSDFRTRTLRNALDATAQAALRPGKD